MRRQALWAAFVGGLLTVAAGALGSCKSVEACKPGTQGCVGGAPNGEGKCQFDLVRAGDKCVEPDASGNDAGAPGGDAGEDAAVGPCGECEAPALCVPERKECVNYCETPEEVPGTGPTYTTIPCTGEPKGKEKWDLTFAESCKNTCLLQCRAKNWFCGLDKPLECEEECSKDAVQTACTLGCGADESCQDKKCSAAHALTCADVVRDNLCPTGSKAACADFLCTHACGKGTRDDDNLFDGFCDDGAYTQSDTAFCPVGTDCADCGPRPSAIDPRDVGTIAFGDPCPNSSRCEGNSGNYQFNESWCVPAFADVGRCLRDCSVKGETCPDGYDCVELVDSATGEPKKDSSGVQGKVCVPRVEDLCK